MNINELFEELSELNQVEAVALGGSRATGKGDEKSDYDVYVYVTAEIPDTVRKEILEKYCTKMEIGNHYWEAEDNCVLKDGVDIDIIMQNMNLLSGCLPSYDMQIKKAYLRKDYNSINHRVTEFLASYFDIIFAVNEMTHPGEKRLVQLCKEQCKILPEHFEENLEKLFCEMFQGDVCGIISEMTEEIRKITE